MIEIQTQESTFKVVEDGKIIAHGFPTIEMALHGIWVLKGSDHGVFYECTADGVVCEVERENES